jgi:hypothetical protein
MSAATQPGQQPYYFVPAPSHFPVLTATGLFFVILGAGQWVNGHGWGAWVTLFGFLLWAFILQGWFRQAIGESEGGLYGNRIDVSFRWSMSWFIFSEVMFFGAFFGTRCCGPTSRRSGRAPARVPPARRRASSSPSRPWARGRCPPSTPCCC